MQISHEEILFVGDQTKKEIYLTNNSQSIIIFKIKSNSIESSKPTPARGFIEIKQTKIVTIPSVKYQAKLMFNWTFVENKSDNFDDSWKKISSSSLCQKIVPIVRKTIINEKQINQFDIQEEDSFEMKSSSMSYEDNLINSKSNSNTNPMASSKQKNQQLLNSVTSPLSKTFSLQDFGKKQNQNDKKKHESKQIKITETRFLKQQIRPANYNNRNQSQNLSTVQGTTRPPKENHIQNSNIQFQQTQTIYRGGSQQNTVYPPQNVNELTQLCFVQSQLLVERQQCQRLKEELRKNKEMERGRDEMMMQYSINRSMREQCQNDGVNWEGMIVIALIFMTVGFLLSRF